MARGFASMTPERRSIIASQGGRAAHAKGVGHRFDTDEARAAGKKSALSRVARQRATRTSPDPEAA
jgi:uncharacterized protein